MTRSVEKYVEWDLFFRALGRQRLAVRPHARIALLGVPADRRGDGIAHRICRVALLAGKRGAGRRIERTLAAARSQPERSGERSRQGETEKRTVEITVQATRS